MNEPLDRVRAALSRRGAHNPDDALKILDLPAGGVPHGRALYNLLDEFVEEHPHLFVGIDFADTSKSIDSLVGQYVDHQEKLERAERDRHEIDFGDQRRTIEEITADFIRQEVL